MKKSRIGVVLGRFAPLHKGHELLISKAIKRHGDSVLVLIGSSEQNTDGRTPYTYKTREKMVRSQFPSVTIMPLPDVGENQAAFDRTNVAWLDQISQLETKMHANFTFYGGSIEDLKYLSARFKTEVLVSREVLPMHATEAREHIEKDESIAHMVSQDVIPPAVEQFGEQ